MSIITPRLHWFGATSVAALSLCAVATPLSSAKAFIGVDVGGVSVGIGGPVYGYSYPYAPAYSYGPSYSYAPPYYPSYAPAYSYGPSYYAPYQTGLSPYAEGGY